MSDSFYKNGLKFECTQCHACCRHDPGYVFLSRQDLDKLCAAFGLGDAEFIEKYCRWVDLGAGPVLSLLEKKNFDCIFWDQGCTVYHSRPLQCRTYPFWENPLQSKENWNWEARFCPGIGRGKVHSAEDIDASLHLRRNAPVLHREDL